MVVSGDRSGATCMVVSTGSTGGYRSQPGMDQISPCPKNGGAEGDRTPDLYNAIVALSQLSYGPVPFVRRVLGDPAAPRSSPGRTAPLVGAPKVGKRKNR